MNGTLQAAAYVVFAAMCPAKAALGKVPVDKLLAKKPIVVGLCDHHDAAIS